MKRVGLYMLIIGLASAALVPALAQAPFDARVLIWEFTPQQDGQLKLLTTAGDEEMLLKFPDRQSGNMVIRCGPDYWSADGQGIVLYTGAASGDIAIYPLAGGNPILLGTANRMACAGRTSFQFDPKHARAGYIDYSTDALQKEFPYGNLRIAAASSGKELATFDWTTAFTLYDDGVLMLRFYPDGKGHASEADVDWWDGSTRQTLATLKPIYPSDKPDTECGMTSGSIARVGDTAYILTGQWCATGVTRWRLVSVPMAGGQATTIAHGQPAGGYFSESFTTELFPTTDSAGFLVTVPSGLGRNTVFLYWVTLDGTVTPVLEGQHVIANRFGELLSEGRHMMMSADDSTLAFVTTTGNQEQSLWLLDLSTSGGEPLLVEAEGINQRIFQYIWASNNVLYYLAGSIESSSLHMIAPGQESQRLARGRFFRLATSYTGDKIATAEWYANPNSVGDDLFKLTLWDTEGKTFLLKEGGEDHNQMIPLAIQ